MGGYRTDSPLAGRLAHIVEYLDSAGERGMAEDIEEAVAVIRDGVQRPCHVQWVEESLGGSTQTVSEVRS